MWLDGVSKHADGVSKHADGVSKHDVSVWLDRDTRRDDGRPAHHLPARRRGVREVGSGEHGAGAWPGRVALRSTCGGHGGRVSEWRRRGLAVRGFDARARAGRVRGRLVLMQARFLAAHSLYTRLTRCRRRRPPPAQPPTHPPLPHNTTARESYARPTSFAPSPSPRLVFSAHRSKRLVAGAATRGPRRHRSR